MNNNDDDTSQIDGDWDDFLNLDDGDWMNIEPPTDCIELIKAYCSATDEELLNGTW